MNYSDHTSNKMGVGHQFTENKQWHVNYFIAIISDWFPRRTHMKYRVLTYACQDYGGGGTE